MAPNRLCLITALAPVPAFLGGSCPLGCSLNAPATGGCSVFSLQWSMYAAGSEKEKRAGCPLHGATIAQLFVFCKGGVGGALPGRKVLVWPAPSYSGGPAWPAPLSRTPFDVFQNRGTRRTSRRNIGFPAPSFGDRRGAAFDCMFVTLVSRIAGFAGTEPLQRHYKPLQGRYRPLQSCYGAVTSRYGAVTNLTSRYGVGWLQRACTLQRHWLRSQPSSDGCALGGTSLSAPATGGFSVVSPQSKCMRQAPRKRSGPGAHFLEAP